MSTWSVRAIKRLGAPDVAWPSVFGPASGADPIDANALPVMDLTPDLKPLSTLKSQMERDLTLGSYSSIEIDLVDRDGDLALALGPAGFMASPSSYFGPWIQVIESWGAGQSAVRFLGYMDETSCQWFEDEARTQFTAIHASQLLLERLVTDFPSLLRPWPSVPTGATQDFIQSTADALLEVKAQSNASTRPDAVAIEAALWAVGQLSWVVRIRRDYIGIDPSDPDSHPRPRYYNFDPPAAPSSSIVIGGHTYSVNHIAWDPTIEAEDADPDRDSFEDITWAVARIYLQGAPDLTGTLALGDTVAWGLLESRRTHYLLRGDSIAEPVAGSDGPKSILLNTIEQLAPGDVLTLTFVDASSGKPRLTSADLPPIIDTDGETGTAFLAKPLTQGYSHVSRVRRNSQDPVLFDGVAYARALVAPFELDDSQFVSAPTSTPVLTWQPYDLATPSLYGVHHLQTVNPSGGLMLARRGPSGGISGGHPTAGVWSGSFGGAWTWLGQPTPDATHLIYGDVLQWPGGVNAHAAPGIYVEGDLSGGAIIPVNGWRHAWRSWKDLDAQSQDPESTWNGTAIQWTSHVYSADIPAKLVAFMASSPTPGRYARTADGTWSFQAHSGDGALDAATTPTITGTLPSGNWLALGMGIIRNLDEEEALLGLVVQGTAYPFTGVSAVVLAQSAGGALDVRQTQTLWATGDTAPGPWALGGGLVVQGYTETIDDLVYPRTRLHKLNGAGVVTADFKTLEIIPQTIQPLLLTGAAGARSVGGWYALALETYADENFAISRRLRHLHLDSQLRVVNGDPESDPAAPADPTAAFSRGELVASVVPDGALIAKMVRTSATTNAMAGIIGGRIFTVGNTIPRTVERLKLGATVPKGATLNVAHSGDGMAVSDFLQKFATAQLASVVPAPNGGVALVSRSAGALRLRSLGGIMASVLESERGKKTRTLAWGGYIRKVRVTYTDLLADATASVEVEASYDGGRVIEEDLSDLVCSTTMSRAIGQAIGFWMGQPAAVLTEEWTDRVHGLAGNLPPCFWADWQIGDRVVLNQFTPGDPVYAHKILSMTPGLEKRSVAVQLREQPFQIVAGDP